jgi:DNA-binding NarL/FixJ family response regulator
VIRLLLVDDQPLVRKGLRRIFDRRHGFDVVGELEDGRDILDVTEQLGPDVVIMDMRMRDVDGESATRRLRAKPGAPPVLVLTTFDDDETIHAALADLIRAVRSLAAGQGWIDEAVVGRVLATYREAVPAPASTSLLAQLTPRELDVLRLVGDGMSNAEIAAELHVSTGTVKTHVSSLLAKLGLRDRIAAVVFAFQHRLAAPANLPD